MTTHLVTRGSRTAGVPGGLLRAALFVLALLVGPAWSAARATAAEITAANVADHVASAKSAADYQALATYFRSAAAAQAETVNEHEAMLASYKERGGKAYTKMKLHCQGIIRGARNLQRDYEAMAAEYEQMAKEAK